MAASGLPRSRHRLLVLRLWVMVAAMAAFGFALVPLYGAFCKVTGLKPRPVAAAGPAGFADRSRDVEVQFVTVADTRLPVLFHADTSRLNVHPGQLYEVTFRAQNRSPATVSARAVSSFAPGNAAAYFRDTVCFCSHRETLAAGQVLEMPLRFYLDPALPAGIRSITLSYTFYNVTGKIRADAT